MTNSARDDSIETYVRGIVRFGPVAEDSPCGQDMIDRLVQAFKLLPAETADLFLLGNRKLTITIHPDPGLPLGMRTTSSGPAESRRYTIILFEEHHTWTADLFIASILRELGHVVAGRPPEDEWPASRSQRTRFREMLECRADAMVWRWGLRDYSIRHLYATYPEHRVEELIVQIGRMLLQEYSPRGMDS